MNAPHRKRLTTVLGLAALLLALLPAVARAGDQHRPFAPRATGTFAVTDTTVLRPFRSGQAEVKVALNGRFALVATDFATQKVDLAARPHRVVGTQVGVAGHVVAIRPDSRWAYVVDEPPTVRIPNTLHVLDVRGNSLRRVRSLSGTRFAGRGEVSDLEVSRNGRFLYVKQPNRIKVFSLRNPARPVLVRTVKAPEGGGELSITRDGKRLLSLSTSGSGWYNVYALTTPARPRRITTRRISVGDAYAIASNLSTSSAYLVTDSSSIDGPTQYVRFSGATGGGARAWTVPDFADITDAALSPDGRYLFAVSLGGVYERSGVIDTATMRPVSTLNGTSFGRAVTFSPAGRAYVVTTASSTGQRVLVEVSRR
ncbi:WD40 repeat domain-containing protein [Nocardioides sp. LML1-1-1.1]|uniref:WD40 repeat domain-containing protein n=1 Tax=Nocardioides sp. LML1-1-1.1 TaxID=3135248 RepID=UPI00342B50E7